MSPTAEAIRRRKLAGDTFRPAEIVAWTADADDIELAATVHDLLQSHRDQIQPDLDWNAIRPFVLAYLIRCIRDDRGSELTHSGYEAAWELAAILKFWAKYDELSSLVQQAEQELARSYISGDDALRDRIVNGTVEHALELPCVRPYFARWESHPELRNAWSLAMLWAKAHEDGGG